jgi:hypothetical protein
MKIASAELQFASSHSSMQRHEVSESLRAWVGPQRPDFEGRGVANAAPARPQVVISDAGKAAGASSIDKELEDRIDEDPRLMLMRLMLEALTGKSTRIFDARELSDRSRPVNAPAVPTNNDGQNGNAAAGFGIEYDYHESYTEVEATSFSASGVVKTADGQEIRFDVKLLMSRAYHEESSISLRLGDAARKVDPLVLNFAGNAASLVDQRFSFDLNSDGKEEQIARLASGSAYLVFDRNGDGRINNGSEMFGPNTGDGFAELSQLDDDGNGWIDENDRAWQKLSLWHPDENGEGELKSLSDSGVGAIALARVATPFDLKGSANELFGQIRTSGIFLHEDGRAGTIQQIDLAV